MTLSDAVYQLNALRGRRPLRALHLFAGAGGSVLAGRMLGWESVGAVELDEFCCAVLEANGEHVLHRDITTFDARPLRGKVDVVVGGFPCQDLSSAGRRAGFKHGKRSILFHEMMRVVDETQAPVIFAENVRGLLNSHEGRDFATVLNEMAKRGFDARWHLLGADDAGAPHQRKRVWILAHRHVAYPAGGGRRQSGPEHATAVPDGAGAGVAHADEGPRGSRTEGRGADASAIRADQGQRGAELAHAGRGGDERRGEPRDFFGADSEAGQEASQRRWSGDAAGHGGEAMAESPGPGLQERGGVGARGLGERGPQPAVAAPPGRPAEPGLGGAAHGLAGGVDLAAAGAGGLAAAQRWPAGRGEDQHPWEAPRLIGRGVAWRVPRLRALGNGWVPQTAVLAWRTLTEEP